ncbi:DNA mismatch repair endonuclease MutL [Halonatronum saccharophilum]|uniref:DNA mismatch repair endonuclease MutL n=1 Tax=Halonatronum saccharophilum TaxID=150060 RepID=UPI000489E399|nr:DNA mismatch repair endonuclease MutL [Halonatronum saccharophilum]
MGKVKLLSEEVANKIAAGEVIERPASVVKELVENSIDAGSDRIEIKVKDGGKSLIQIIDNGEGMDEEDARLAFERHATSKVERANDLFALRTLGFRGEALSSIAAISRLTLITKTKSSLSGSKIRIVGGEVEKEESCGAPVGTNISVKDLFFNTPVRYKYLKQTSTEIGHISDIINRLSLAYPNISFSLEHNGRKILETTGNGNLIDVIFNIYGKDLAKEMIEIDYSDDYMSVKGYVSKPKVTRSSRKHQSFFVNGRYVKSYLMSKAVDDAYHTLLTVNRYPIVTLSLKLNPILVDVNVHPTKLEAKFSRTDNVYDLVKIGVRKALGNSDLVPKLELKNQVKKKEKLVEQGELELKKKKLSSPKKAKEAKDYSKAKSSYRGNYDNFKPKDSKEERREKIEKLFGVNKTGGKEGIKVSKVEDINVPKESIKEEQGEYKEDQELNLIPIGQIHQSYIVAQGLDGMHIIDQHAAHERVMYEQLTKEFKGGKLRSQELLIPLTLDLTHQEVEVLKERGEELQKVGFSLEEFGGNSYLLRSVPVGLFNLNNEELIYKCIDSLLEGQEIDGYKLIEDILITISCKSAIKAGDKLSSQEMNKLIDDMEKYGVTNCPHGRPVMMHLSKSQLEKEFKRK